MGFWHVDQSLLIVHIVHSRPPEMSKVPPVKVRGKAIHSIYNTDVVIVTAPQ